MEQLVSQFLAHVRGMWKYRWHTVVAAWLVAIVGWSVVHSLPDDYEASARIYVDTQSVLQPLMSGMAIPANLEQQVSIMSRTLISRPNVERVMRMVDLDIKAKNPKEREQLINDLTNGIRMVSTGRENLFTISYSNESPKIAKDVVQSLLTIFVEGDINDKKKDTTSALRFIDDQIKEYQDKLIAAEASLKEFKQKNMGLMPGQGGDYISQLSAASDLLNQAKLELREAEQSQAALQRQITSYESSLGSDVSPEIEVNPEIEARIQTLSKNLDALRLNFTEQHPDIVATKRLIANLEEQKKAEAKRSKPKSNSGKNDNPMFQQMSISLAETEARAAAMRARVQEYSSRYYRLKSMSNAVPEVEADLAQLTRDYQVNKENYEKLIERRESAKMSGDMGATSELVTFKIIDPPITPQLPTGPNFKLLNSFVLLGAIAVGLGISLVMSQLVPTFNSLSDLREITGRPVLGTVARIWTIQETKKHKREIYVLSLSFILLLGIYGVLMAKVLQRGVPS